MCNQIEGRGVRWASWVLAMCVSVAAPIQAMAALVTYTNQSTFVAATSPNTFESFEGLADRPLLHQPVVASYFTMTPVDSDVDVRSSPTGGHYATDGVKYSQFGDPNLGPAGTLRFDLNTPATSFGLSITDWGDAAAAGTLTIKTNVGEGAAGMLISTNPPRVASGGLLFFGFAQDTPFTSVSLTSTTASDGMGIDAIYITSTPEPSGAVLGAMSGVLLLRRRRLTNKSW